jgi:modification methylase
MDFNTSHNIYCANSNSMSQIEDGSVSLVVTSPPYPMIQMWDEMYGRQNSEIKTSLYCGNGEAAFILMHAELDKAWEEVYRVLQDGGILCINIGDAVRSIGYKFQVFVNHSRILQACLSIGFHALPLILWVKDTNRPDKYMGSGMLPAGAYVTLEHEYILVLRKKEKREFKTKEEKENRRKSAFFWEERNQWFVDKWKDIPGTSQKVSLDKSRDRSAAFPLDIPYRLICMFSVMGDKVLDPFLGTGTTMLAAMMTGRNSIGYEIDSSLAEIVSDRVSCILRIANAHNEQRLQRHVKFMKRDRLPWNPVHYTNERYGFPVVTKQETELSIPFVNNAFLDTDGKFRINHTFDHVATACQ